MTLPPPRLEACYFDSGSGMFARMAAVLQLTARLRLPGWERHIVRLGHDPNAIDGATCNRRKLDYWARVVCEAPNGSRILLMDADTMVLRPLDEVWERPFDVAYTLRDQSRTPMPINAGVVFLRVGEGVRDFMRAWAAENVRQLETPEDHARWHRKYGGWNQAALGALLEGGIMRRLGLVDAMLPCAEWNCEESTWEDFDLDVTRILHVKSRLRLAALAMAAPPARLRDLVRLWRSADAEARRIAA